ncbi:hypothetical protein B0H11DRAFT_2140921 [Mycena galericulata]|nr:hypothetical protein B0H11DRAFT_2140921 [Mycena galericulata]
MVVNSKAVFFKLSTKTIDLLSEEFLTIPLLLFLLAQQALCNLYTIQNALQNKREYIHLQLQLIALYLYND